MTSALSGLTTVNDATVGVALAAGIAGMLALETRASSAVGVAISITTIPAAAYFGVAVAVGEMGQGVGRPRRPGGQRGHAAGRRDVDARRSAVGRAPRPAHRQEHALSASQDDRRSNAQDLAGRRAHMARVVAIGNRRGPASRSGTLTVVVAAA